MTNGRIILLTTATTCLSSVILEDSHPPHGPSAPRGPREQQSGEGGVVHMLRVSAEPRGCGQRSVDGGSLRSGISRTDPELQVAPPGTDHAFPSVFSYRWQAGGARSSGTDKQK